MARQRNDDKWNAFFDFVFYYGSWLWLPAMVLLTGWWHNGIIPATLFWGATALIALCFYGRFLEPRWLKVNTVNLDLTPIEYTGPQTTLKLALFSDTHYGIFGNVMPLHRLRKKIEQYDVDVVLVAGDLTNHLMPHEMPRAFGDFANFREPVYAVLGNHDHGLPGWIMPDEIAATLSNYGVRVLDNETVKLEIDGTEVLLTGLRDHYAGSSNYALLAANSKSPLTPHLVLAHNADAAWDYPKGVRADLTLSGHTHGGQIRLPFIYRRFIPTRHKFDQGLYLANGHKVYVSSGTGMDVLPVRLFIPPALDILTLTVPAPQKAESVT